MTSRHLLILTAAFALACTEPPGPEVDMSGPTPVEDMYTEPLDTSPPPRPDMTAEPDASPDPDVSPEPDAAPDLPPAMCVDTTVYADADGDGRAEEGAATSTVCLSPGQDPEAGFARGLGDCDDADPLQYEGAQGVCNDYVDDDCDGMDEACPTSIPNQMNIPEWDCTGDPPANVYAWARFDDGKGYFKPGGCFVFFEGSKSVFYVQRVGIERPAPCMNANQGCTCPSDQGRPAYDRRMYAFTRDPGVTDCPNIPLSDAQPNGMRIEDQPVSNACRKYLLQMHEGREENIIQLSHVASSLDALEERLERYSVVEISCLEDQPHTWLPHTDLITMDLSYNEGYTPLR